MHILVILVKVKRRICECKTGQCHADLCVPFYFSLLHTAHMPVNVTDAVGVLPASMSECAEGGADHC